MWSSITSEVWEQNTSPYFLDKNFKKFYQSIGITQMPQHANSFYISEAIFLFVRQNSTNTLVYKNAPNVIEDPVFSNLKFIVVAHCIQQPQRARFYLFQSISSKWALIMIHNFAFWYDVEAIKWGIKLS